MRLIVTKTSEEAKLEMEAFDKDREVKKKSRFCPECGKFQPFRKKIIKERLGSRREYLAGYSYECYACGCEWNLLY